MITATGVSDTLRNLWMRRDAALESEKREGIPPMTSEMYIKAQRSIDKYFIGSKNKAQRGKPKKRFVKDDDWG